MTCRAKSYVNGQADTEGGREMQISAINPPLNLEKILSFLAPPKSESKRGEMATPIPCDIGEKRTCFDTVIITVVGEERVNFSDLRLQ